jgi:hypothetical protein
MQVNGPIKLRARDVDDMQVLSSCLQDALVSVGDIAYLKAEKRFVLVANRFMWENGPQDPPAPESPEDPADARFEDQDAGPLYERSYCGLCFDRVKQVTWRIWANPGRPAGGPPTRPRAKPPATIPNLGDKDPSHGAYPPSG